MKIGRLNIESFCAIDFTFMTLLFRRSDVDPYTFNQNVSEKEQIYVKEKGEQSPGMPK